MLIFQKTTVLKYRPWLLVLGVLYDNLRHQLVVLEVMDLEEVSSLHQVIKVT